MKKSGETKTQAHIRREMRALEIRVGGMEKINQMIIEVQRESLWKAEQLRKAVLKLMRGSWTHRCSDGVGGCHLAVSESEFKAMKAIAESLPALHRGPRKIRIRTTKPKPGRTT